MGTNVRRMRVEIEFQDGTRNIMVLRNPRLFESNLQRHLTQVVDANTGRAENIPTGLHSLTLRAETTNFYQKIERNEVGKGRPG